MKRLIISFDMLRDLFTEGQHPAKGYRVVKDALPPQSILVNARYAWPHCLELLIQDESFPEAKDGDEIPVLDVTCVRKSHS